MTHECQADPNHPLACEGSLNEIKNPERLKWNEIFLVSMTKEKLFPIRNEKISFLEPFKNANLIHILQLKIFPLESRRKKFNAEGKKKEIKLFIPTKQQHKANVSSSYYQLECAANL